MEPQPRLSPRERLLRIAGGAALVAAGCAVFAYSKARDPENRAAVLAIFAIAVGASWIGHGIRGRRDSIVHREEEAPPGPPISPERTLAGILAAWLVPGLGHLLIGRRWKALLYFATITLTFLAGTWLAEGRNLSFDRDPIYFGAYLFNAGETALGWLLTHRLELDHKIPYHQLGLTYTAVACLLNVVAMMDFVATCGRSVDAQDAEGTAAGGGA
ncbi:MAG TPA: DUF6677 family protein [Planctomycetota bacterium]|nr:DUF6677 family protein [Planctomycetota bacterium]